jgi:hypothetical protein
LILRTASGTSARDWWAAILVSPLSELTGFNFAVDCLAADRGGERTFAVADLASFYGRNRAVGSPVAAVRAPRGREDCDTDNGSLRRGTAVRS